MQLKLSRMYLESSDPQSLVSLLTNVFDLEFNDFETHFFGIDIKIVKVKKVNKHNPSLFDYEAGSNAELMELKQKIDFHNYRCPESLVRYEYKQGQLDLYDHDGRKISITSSISTRNSSHKLTKSEVRNC